MTVQKEARERLRAIRQRVQPANDMLDSVFSINTPSDIRAELDQLKASYDIVNQQAKGNDAWDAHYKEFLQFYAETRPRTEGTLGWLRTSSATLSNIRNRAQRLEEWKGVLRQQKVNIAEPTKQLPPSPLNGLSDTVKLGLAGLGIWALMRAVSR